MPNLGDRWAGEKPKPESDHLREQAEFFSTYAQNYTEPEVVWLSRTIAGAGPMAGPDSIARVVLAAGYVRTPPEVTS